MWRQTYSFARKRANISSRTDKYVKDNLSSPLNLKNEFLVVEILEFLVPILYLEKPTRITITIGNTIFGILKGE